MAGRRQISNRCKSIRYFIIALVSIALIPDLGVCSNLNDVRIHLDWSPDNPSKSYNIIISYIINTDNKEKSDDNILYGVPEDDEVSVWLEPASRDEFDAIFPTGYVTMGPDFVSEYIWGIELKDNNKDPLLVLHWKLETTARHHNSSIPKGEFPIKIPDGPYSGDMDKENPDYWTFG
jgi:hypothetical protein